LALSQGSPTYMISVHQRYTRQRDRKHTLALPAHTRARCR